MGNKKEWKWHDWELGLIDLWAGTMPIPDLVNALNKERNNLGLPPRTPYSVKKHTWRRGVSLRADLSTGADYQAVQAWEKALGLRLDALYRLWSKSRHGKKHQPGAKTRLSIAHVDALLAKDPPTAAWAGIERLKAYGLTKAIRAIESQPKIIPHADRPVRRCDGKEYKTVLIASQEMKISRPAIYRALRLGTRSGGFYWEYIGMTEDKNTHTRNTK
jgi:hypothetical protein